MSHNVQEARELASKVDKFVYDAHKESWLADFGNLEHFQNFYRNDVPLVDFIEAYVAGKRYPDDRIVEIVKRLIDVKLQLEYVTFDLGSINEKYYARLQENEPSPRLKLRRMALEQSVIGRTRIVWEKLMRVIYYLEEGGDLARKKGSFKGAFFAWVKTSAPPNWRFLIPYAQVIEEHDQRLRTPEFHKHSVIRGYATRDRELNPEELLRLHNYIHTILPGNLLAIVSEGWPSSFTDLHSSSPGSFDIDPTYLRPS